MDFRLLLEKITPALRAVARRHLLCSHYDEEDLYQEMCLFLWQKYQDGLPIGINEAYVIKGCEFHLLNFLRKGRSRFDTFSVDEPLYSNGSSLVDRLESMHENMLYNSDAMLVIDDIMNMGLTDKEKKVLTFLIRGYTVREIAEMMGISHVMVVKHKKNISKKMREKGYQA